MSKVYKKLISMMLVPGFSVCLYGCNNKSNTNINYNDDFSSNECSSDVQYNIPTTSLNTLDCTTKILEITTILTTTANDYSTSTTTVNNNISSDDIVLNYFDDLNSNVRSNFSSDNFLDIGKSYFKTCVDFLFFDSSINGIKFSDLTDGVKQQILLDISLIDELICSKFPNYKENISEGASNIYNSAAMIIKKGSEDINLFAYDKLGEENYNKALDIKDMFIEQTSSDFEEFKGILSSGKEKVKSYYEGHFN